MIMNYDGLEYLSFPPLDGQSQGHQAVGNQTEAGLKLCQGTAVSKGEERGEREREREREREKVRERERSIFVNHCTQQLYTTSRGYKL